MRLHIGSLVVLAGAPSDAFDRRFRYGLAVRLVPKPDDQNLGSKEIADIRNC